MLALDLVDRLEGWIKEKGNLEVKLATDAFLDKEWDSEYLLPIGGAAYHEGTVPLIVID